jgi:predicted flavoprotein YhiN
MRDFDNNKYTISIDLKPALDEETLDKRLISDFSKYAKNNFSNSLGDLFPSKMIPVILKKSSIPSQKKCSEITKEQRLELLNIIKNFKIEISNPRPMKRNSPQEEEINSLQSINNGIKLVKAIFGRKV